MLLRLKINNLATIRQIEIEFEQGFSILTGETGAGKSIIIDALHFITGKKADYSLIRSGQSQALVEAIFDISNLTNVQLTLQKIDIPFESELIIRRVLQVNNRQKIFLNEVAVTRITLEELGKLLVTIHGQHDNQTLLQVSSHVDFLDGFGHLMDLRNTVKTSYHIFQQDLKAYETFKQQLREDSRQIEELLFRQKEIKEMDLKVDEEEVLTRDAQILSNATKLSLIFAEAQEVLYDQDGSLVERLGVIRQSLQEAEKVDPECTDFRQTLEDCLLEIEDLRRGFGKYASRYLENPQRLEWTNQRLSQIQTLKRKYGRSIPELLEYLQQITEKLDQLENPEKSEKTLHEKTEASKAALEHQSHILSAARHRAAKKLNRQVREELFQLGMEKVRFETQLNLKTQKNPERSAQHTPNGIDQVEFLLSVNPGQSLRSLAKAASGGELSRIMLALKTVLLSIDPVETLIFDEIDSGISGRIAEMVGYKLHSLGQVHQALCVTHLPQIVSFSQHHFAISKTIHQNATYTSIQALNPQDRVKELARLMGGSEITSQTLSLASEMLERARQQKAS